MTRPTRAPCRWLIFLCSSLVVLVAVVGSDKDVQAYSDKTTHVQLAERTVELAVTDPFCAGADWKCPYQEVRRFAELIARADQAEDRGDRGDNHFFDPKTRGGLATSSLIRVVGGTRIPLVRWYVGLGPGRRKADDSLPHYISALDWATDQMGSGPGLDGKWKELDWRGAIESYDYTPDAKRDAYEAVGHVLHLLQDMGQPDHVRLRPHPCNYLREYLSPVLPDRAGYEALWERENKSWPPGKTPEKFKTLDEAFTKLATESRAAESNLGLPMKDEIALGCGRPRGLLKWSIGVPVESLSTEIAGLYDLLQWVVTGHPTERFFAKTWNTYEFNNVPAVPMIPWPPGDSRTQKYLELGRKLLPRVEEYGAGLLRLFHDIVNPAAFVEEVEIYQGGQLKYRKTWKDDEASSDPPHLRGRRAEVEGGELEGGAEAKILIRIGPRDPDPKANGIFIRKALKTLNVTVVPEGGGPEDTTPVPVAEQGEPTSPRGGTWVGIFTPTRSATFRITGTDSAEHFKDASGEREQSLTPVDGKRGTQGDLDSDPSTPARATWRESKAGDQAPARAPYPWKGYEAGPDTNHRFTVRAVCAALTPKTIEAMRWGTWTGRAVSTVKGTWGEERREATVSFRALVDMTGDPSALQYPGEIESADPLIHLGRATGAVALSEPPYRPASFPIVESYGYIDLRDPKHLADPTLKLKHELNLALPQSDITPSGDRMPDKVLPAQVGLRVESGDLCDNGSWSGTFTDRSYGQTSWSFTFTPSPPPPHVPVHLNTMHLNFQTHAGMDFYHRSLMRIVNELGPRLAKAGRKDEFHRIVTAEIAVEAVGLHSVWLRRAWLEGPWLRYNYVLDMLNLAWCCGNSPTHAPVAGWTTEKSYQYWQDQLQALKKSRDQYYDEQLKALQASVDAFKEEQRTAERECVRLSVELAKAVHAVDPDAGQRISALAEMLLRQGFDGLASGRSDGTSGSSPKPGWSGGKN